jgi:hypothetical protein
LLSDQLAGMSAGWEWMHFINTIAVTFCTGYVIRLFGVIMMIIHRSLQVAAAPPNAGQVAAPHS